MTLGNRFLIGILGFIAALGSASAQLQIFVAPNGSDSNSGTVIGQPFQTLTRARNFIRSQQPLAAGAVVNIRAGEYTFNSTLQLNGNQDSGSANGPIVWSAYNGEEVIFSGAGSLDFANFSQVTDTAILDRLVDQSIRLDLVQIDLTGIDLGEINRRGWGQIVGPQGAFPDDPEFELIIDGKRMQLARWPNPSEAPLNLGDPKGSVDMVSVVDSGPTSSSPDYTTAGGTFSYDFGAINRPASWSAATDIWLSGPLDRAWEWDYIPVASIDSTAQEITLGQGVDSGLSNQESFFHFENLLEEIDERGEYYIDRSTSTLYLYPPLNFATASIRYTSFQGFNFIRNLNASYLEFHDIIFESSRRSAMDLQADHLRVKRCEFRNMRGGGLLIAGEDIGVTDSVFHNLGTRGILIGKFGADSDIGNKATLEAGNVFVENCEFYELSYHVKNYRPSIQMLEGVSPRISHCYFHDNPHYSVGGNENNGIIEYCEFENTPALLADIGAVYYNTGFSPEIQGTIVRRNYFHDIGYDVERGKMSGVYLDNTSRGIVIEENIFNRVGRKSSDWTVFNHGGAPGVIRNNVFIDCPNPITQAYAIVLNTYMNIGRFIPAWEQTLGTPSDPNLLGGTDFLLQYPELQTFIPGNGDYEPNKALPLTRINRNLFYNPTSPLLNNGDGTDDAIAISTPPANLSEVLDLSNNAIEVSNPGFANLANDDFSFPSGVTTSITSFNDPQFSKMGLTGPVGPRSTAAIPAEPALAFEMGVFFTANADIDVSYSASVATLASDSTAGATLTYEKLSGPDWLSIAANGDVTGTPGTADLGLNQFGMQVTSSTGETAEAILRVVVVGDGVVFLANNFSEREAVVGRDYHASLLLEVVNPDWTKLVNFKDLSGPTWLNLSDEGKLTGQPTSADLGLNTWTVATFDDGGHRDSATFSVTVVATPSSVIYVDAATGNDANPGTSWATAKATIQGGYAAAMTDSEIWVAAETYTGFLLPPSRVSLYGGFQNGDSFADRDPAANETIHSPGRLNIVAKNDIIVDGFTFTNAPDGFNGPIKIDTDTGLQDTDNIVIANCRITGNQSRNVFLARGWRGQRVFNVSVLDTEISMNSSAGDFAGHIGLVGTYGEVSFVRCLIHSNSVGTTTQGAGSGAMDFTGPNALHVENCLFYGNSTGNLGRATAIRTDGGRKSVILHNTFDGLGANAGDALIRATDGGGFIISDNIFHNAEASAIYDTLPGTPVISTNLFSAVTSGITGNDTANTEEEINDLPGASGNLVSIASFLNVASNDYRPIPGSPALNAANASSTVLADILGVARIGQADVGAYEYDPDLQDSDEDNIIDSWELLYALNPIDETDALLDSDGDCLSNLAEYIFGTNPTSSASIWKAGITEGIATDETDFSFTTLSGRTYKIQKSNTLTTGSWSNMMTITGDGNLKEMTLTEAAPVFYRVSVTLEP